jgi:beta-RFAP synthase
MGFLGLGGSLGRKFGSIGVGVNEIATRLSLVHAPELAVAGPDADGARKAVRTLESALGRTLPPRIHIHSAIPHHAGLGSGTQMALAVGMGLSRLHGLGLGVREVAALVGRGGRSGIGIAVFEQGGLLVDAGRGKRTQVPPVISRLEMPDHWRFLIVLDQVDQGLHGAQEIQAFNTLPVFPAEEAARLCHLLLMQGLPAVVEGDIDAFGAVITALQCSVGDHFAPAQGGRFTSPRVREALDFLAARGAVGIGQSSWGPTGFCLVADPEQAERLRSAVMDQFGASHTLQCLIGTPRHEGSSVRVMPSRVDGA